MITNAGVARAWAAGRPGQSGTMRTDGVDIFSYALRIGTTIDGRKIGYKYQSPRFVSRRTSHHVSTLFGHADEIVEPVVDIVDIVERGLRSVHPNASFAYDWNVNGE